MCFVQLKCAWHRSFQTYSKFRSVLMAPLHWDTIRIQLPCPPSVWLLEFDYHFACHKDSCCIYWLKNKQTRCYSKCRKMTICHNWPPPIPTAFWISDNLFDSLWKQDNDVVLLGHFKISSMDSINVAYHGSIGKSIPELNFLLFTFKQIGLLTFPVDIRGKQCVICTVRDWHNSSVRKCNQHCPCWTQMVVRFGKIQIDRILASYPVAPRCLSTQSLIWQFNGFQWW